VAYRNYLAKWLSSSAVAKCNTARRMAAHCQQAYWDEDSYLGLSYYKAYVDNYAAIQENDRCVKAIYTSQYWDLAEAFTAPQDEDDDDFAVLMAVGWALASSLI
jgi:hypothetical protein